MTSVPPSGSERPTEDSPLRIDSPLWLLVPLCVALGGVWWIAREPDAVLRPTEDLAREGADSVQAFSGRFQTPTGSVLEVELLPLGADAELQAAEGKSLARRLGLPEGEPWRASLQWNSPGGEGLHLDLASLGVRDAAGPALVGFASHLENSSASSRERALWALFAPRNPELRPGEGFDAFLWGRAPRPEGEGGVEFTGAEALGRRFAEPLFLEPFDLACGLLPGRLARLGDSRPEPHPVEEE